MTEASHPQLPTPLSPSGRRALAAAMLGTANRSAWPQDSTLLVEAVDLVSGALIALAGATPAERGTSCPCCGSSRPATSRAGDQ